MIEPTELHLPNYYISQVVSMTVPYEYNYSKLVKDNEILFILNCADGIKVIYISPSFTKRCHEEENG